MTVTNAADGSVGIENAVTVLFVPGDRPERFIKAVTSGADAVIIDIEDAVAPTAKEHALTATLAALNAHDDTIRALVRINAVGTPTYAAEVEALQDLVSRPGHGLRGVVLPKAEAVSAVADLAARLSAAAGFPVPVVAMIESAAGVTYALELAKTPGVVRLAFGAIDLGVDLNADADSQVLRYGAAQVVVASRAAGIAAPLGSPSTSIRDLSAVAKNATVARSEGFGGCLCIHPGQLAVVQAAFAPTDEQVAWARTVVAAGEAAVQVDGQMIDRPVTERARRILQRAEGTR